MIVGLVGAGNMAAALARGWSAAESGPDQLVISDVDAERAKRLTEEIRGRTAGSNAELAELSDVVVLATKPAALSAVAEETRVTVADRGLPVVSILGATPLASVERAFGPGTAVLRFMPNVAAEVRAGTFCYAPGEALDERTERSLLDLFGLLGEIVPVEERLMDAATAIAGCGPAFFALVAESLVDAGVKEGLDARQAARLAMTTMGGTAELMRKRGGDAVGLRRAVTSPGGTTAAGLAALEGYGVRAAFGAAVEAVVRKAEAAQAASGGDSA